MKSIVRAVRSGAERGAKISGRAWHRCLTGFDGCGIVVWQVCGCARFTSLAARLCRRSRPTMRWAAPDALGCCIYPKTKLRRTPIHLFQCLFYSAANAYICYIYYICSILYITIIYYIIYYYILMLYICCLFAFGVLQLIRD